MSWITYFWRFDVTEDNAKGMDVMQTLYKVDSKSAHGTFGQMLILRDDRG